ncbi:hypothetical protein PVT71_17615 [Salipiger sp. H15]|uniref:Curlin n=1 Tax=Alloyangia sp. H15 TaxID=3029062 RepID=A0AAU8APQ6_9RHOB
MSSFLKSGAPILIAGAFLANTVQAGSDNTLFILQDSSFGGLGNTLFVDQGDASGSTISGALGETLPAQQTGFGNIAEVLLTGEAAAVVLLQNNTGAGADAELNSATLTGGTLATLILQQDGVGNEGAVTVLGLDATGALFQSGNDNTGSVEVTGDQAFGKLEQIGNGNTSGLQVQGAGASVTYTQIGDNLTSATLPTVYSNGGAVSITQASY